MIQPYQISADKLLEKFDTNKEQGLSNREAMRRLREYGYNRIPDKDRRGFLQLFKNQFQDFMILILMAATVISLLLGEMGDALTIFAIILLNALMGFVQEYKAEKSLQALKKLTAPAARIIRERKIQKLNAEEIVPGDIILVEPGDKVPADARIIETESLQVNESILTGESTPVTKNSQNLYAPELSLPERQNMLFMGTTITRGQARAVIVSTGKQTEMGKIADLIGEQKRQKTPLQRRLKQLGKWLVMSSILITIIIVVAGIWKGLSVYQMFMTGVSLAVAAIPEGLPAIVTLSLAAGVQKMIKRKAIVRRLPAVETLGCATVICTDKTGTLTENKMSVEKLYCNRRIFRFNPRQINVTTRKIIEMGSVCNEARPAEQEKQGPLKKIKYLFVDKKPPPMLGDPTDIAFISALYAANATYLDLQQKYRTVKMEPFDSLRKRVSAVVQKREENSRELWVKGAPEVIFTLGGYLETGGKIEKLTPELRRELTAANDSMAREGLRVIAVACKRLKGNYRHINITKLENDLTIIGLIGLHDPPRPEASKAVEDCQRAGIRPVMITGDHKLTAGVIASAVGISDQNRKIASGKELEKLNDRELKELTKDVAVYARVTPRDKLRIIKAFKNRGEIVAMTGDGINDAPALKEADIGIAMGETGTDVAREVSSIILADDNFATIVAAVEEGRKIYNNIRKFIRYLLSCNLGELLSILLGIIMGLPLPLIPIQILWVNLVTDGLPALALGMDEDQDQVMDKPPRDPGESVFARGMVPRIIAQGLLIGFNTFFIYILSLYRLEGELTLARTMAFNTLVFSQLFFVFSCRSEYRSFWADSPFKSMYLIFAVLISVLMQLSVIYIPLLSRIFKTVPPTGTHWIIILVLSLWSTIVLEIIDYNIRRNSQ